MAMTEEERERVIAAQRAVDEAHDQYDAALDERDALLRTLRATGRVGVTEIGVAIGMHRTMVHRILRPVGSRRDRRQSK